MNIPQFLFAENKTEAPGAQFILHTPSGQLMQVFKQPQTNHPWLVPIPGYDIAILIQNPKQGEVAKDETTSGETRFYIKATAPLMEQVAMVKEAANFYLTERVQKNLKYYERYRTAQ